MLVPGGKAPDALALGTGTVSVDSGCGATAVLVARRGRAFTARWRECQGRRTRLQARFVKRCEAVAVRWRLAGKRSRFIAVRSRCGDGLADLRGVEACDDGNAADCDGCAVDCSAVTDGCVAGASCEGYSGPPHPPATCSQVFLDHPDVLAGCTTGSGDAGTWTTDEDGLPAYDVLVDERCDAAATAYSPRPRPLRDPIHAIGNGHGLMAMAHASGAVELYTQDREDPLDYGLVEFWDPNLHQVALELLTSDLLRAGITDGIERRRRAPAAYTTAGDLVRFTLPPAPGTGVAWGIAPAP